MFRLFKISEDEIIPVKIIYPEDIVLVYNEENKNLYLYRGEYSPKFDEFRADRLYERIINRFLNPNINYLKNLIETAEDDEKITAVKHYIFDHFPNLKKYEFKRTMENIFLLKDIRQKIKSFKNYESSREWRSNLSNLTNLWRLSIFNIVSIFSIMVILILKIMFDINRDNFVFMNSNSTFNPGLWSLWLKDLTLTLIICLLILFGIFVINSLFVLFPLKFPINPNAISVLSSESTKFLKMSEISLPAPTLPPTKEKSEKLVASPVPLKIDLSKKSQSLPNNSNELDEEIFEIPDVPLKKITPPKLSNSLELEELAKKDTPTMKYVLSDCEICKKNVILPVPRKLIQQSKEPVTDVSFLHGTPPHVLVVQLDRDFQVRRRRASNVIYEEK